MKKILRKSASFAMALFMILQVMLPAFATKSRAEEENPNSIKNLENLEIDDESYFSITNSQKIYDKKKIKKGEGNFSIAISMPDTSSNFKLVKRNDLKLYDDKIFRTKEEASKEYWRVKDMLNNQGLDLDLEIIKEDEGYKILDKDEIKNIESGGVAQNSQYGENYSYIDFKILDDFDFNEKGNQKLLNQDKLVFNLEFIKNTSLDPNYNLFEKDEEGNWEVKNEGDIFALINDKKVNIYNTNSLKEDLNSLNSYKEEKESEESEKKLAEEKAKAEEEAKKAKKLEEEKKAKENKEKEDLDKKSDESKESKELSNLEKADKELKTALADKKNTLEKIQKLLISLGEKYKLSRDDQEKLMASNDKAIKDLVEKDRKENFRPNNLRQDPQRPSNSFEDKVFNLKTVMNVKASPVWAIPTGWYFDVHLGPYLKTSTNKIENLKVGNQVVATGEYFENGNDHYIRYTYITRVTHDISLNIDQDLEFDMRNVGSRNFVDVDIKVAPKNNPVQTMPRKTVNKNDPSPVSTAFVVEDKGEQKAGTYPYELKWRTTSQKLKDKNGNVIQDPTRSSLDGAYVEWDIEVDTDTLLDKENNKLDFKKLNLTIFGSSRQGLWDLRAKASKNKADLESVNDYKISSRLGEILTLNTSINKSDLGEKLYIKVKAPVDTENPHEVYSIGLRINPDSNYIKKMVEDALEKFKSIPSIFKWIKGLEEASRFSEVPFNLVEAKIPARIGLRNNYTNERFYYDRTRTIVADRITDNRADWYALDLIRLGEKEDPAFDNPTFTLNNAFEGEKIDPIKYYYVPLQNGGYRRTSQVGDVILENGQYYPGTLVSYEYKNQKGTRNDSYYLKADIKEKKKDNFDPSFAAESEGGHLDLFTEKISESDLRTNYLMYTENPYPVMRINKNFDMVHCFNSGLPDPAHKGKKGIFLDIHENPTGDYLISRLNENINSSNKDKNKGFKLTNYLNNNGTFDGVSLNPDGKKSQGAAMEDLMKRIFYYAEEVKKEYPSENNNKQMHRLIESAMIQKVIHHYTDGNSIYDEYFTTPSNYNDESWKHNHTLSGRRQPYPKTGWDGQFKGKDKSRVLPNGLRKLKDNEDLIKDYPPVKNMQTDQAQNLLTKVINSYKANSDWSEEKANSVKLVFYSHTNEGKYQELITGRVIDPIEIDKFDEKGNKLAGATFTFTNIYTGEKTTWQSKDDENNHKLYLKPGTYRVREKAPEGYEAIKDFSIKVERKEINPDDGPYEFKELPEIHVNDGFKTVVSLDKKTVPKSAEGKDLVTIDNNQIKLSVTNIQDNLGKLEFIKKNKFGRLDGAEFSLRKIKASSLEEAKNQLENPIYDPKYNQSSKGDSGYFKFDQIPEGFFILEETIVPEGYEKAPKYIIQAKKENQTGEKSKVNLYFVGDDRPTEKENGKTVIRNKTKKTEIKFRKVRKEYVLDTEHEHLGLNDAKFRLMSLKLIDGDFYLKEGYTSRTKPSNKKVDGQNATGGGYITFDNLKAGEYLLEELQAPKGYAKTKLYGWKLVVKEIKEGRNKGELEYKLYEVPKEENLQDKNLEEVPLDKIISGDKKVEAFQIGNEARKISIPFDKYLSSGKDGEKPTIVNNKKLLDENGNPIEFNIYKADYYGAIVDNTPINKHPIVQNINKVGTNNPRVFKEKKYDYSFELQDLEFGGYYVLKEKNPPKGYKTASSILLKVEAEAIANEGFMKVIVRDPNPNAFTNKHSLFYGVIDYEKTAKLGEFSIRKIGNAIGFNDENGNPIKVGLRRAYFRLYTADENYDIIYKDPGKKYAKEYIQKVTPGEPITEDNGHGGQKGKDPNKLPPNQGIVTFDQLKPGNYVLEEYRGPAGYEKDSGKWYIHVDEFGVVKKYRNKPNSSTGSREVIYSMESPRYKMSGLNISKPLQFNKLMAPQTSDPKLQEIQPYNVDSTNANISVSASAVNTSDGSRDITVKITPKTKKVGKNKSHWVLMIDRSQDYSNKLNNLDNNINKFITDLRAKADTEGAEVYLSIIEYSGNNIKYNKVLLAKTNIKNLDNASEYSYKMLSLKPRQYENQFDLTEENVTVKDYLSKVGIDRRNGGIVDGGKNLRNVVNSNLAKLTSEDYDTKYVINFANFDSNEAKKPNRFSESFDQFEAMWAFKEKGYKRVYTHVDQTNTEFTPKGNEFKTYISNNSKFNSFDRTLKYILINKGNRKAREFAPYVQKDLLDSILNNSANFASTGKEESLLTNGSINISTNPNVKLESYSIKKNGNEEENQKNPRENSINKNISLKVGENLEINYKISLKSTAENNTNYVIHKNMSYKPDENGEEVVGLDPNRLVTLKDNNTQQEEKYSVIINPTQNGNVSANPISDISLGAPVKLTISPNDSYKLESLTVKKDTDGKFVPTSKIPQTRTLNENEECWTFNMPNSDVKVDAKFKPIPKGNVDLKTDFIYSNQKDGNYDGNPPSKGWAGKIQLYVKEDNGSMPASWLPVGDELNAPFKGNLTFKNLDASKKYRLEYKREESNASLWGTETTSIIDVDLSNPQKRQGQNDLKIMTISNGNLMEIFNKDESGFRIPLRITKVNENKGALTGSQFKARKILNGDRSLWKDILDSNGKPSGRVEKSGKLADKDPIYFDEKYDGVSEATGEPGDNYFRELTPGIYELTEVRAPDGTYRMPVDDEGKPMKWYFQVFVYEGRNPRGADYMGINFYFTHTFTANDSFNKDNVSKEEKNELIGTTIEGLGSKNSKFNKYIKVIPDDGRSNPARPDAPYQGINDAQVTNYKNKTTFSFLKKDKGNYQNIEGAEFSLRKAKTDKQGGVIFGINGKAEYEVEAKTDSNGKALTPEQLSLMRIKPFDENKGYALAKSSEKLGVEFTNIEEGTYILEEDKPKEGFAPLDAYFLVTFKEDNNGAWKQVIKGYKLGTDKKYHEISEESEINKLFDKTKNGKLVSIYNNRNFINFKIEKINAKANEQGEEVPINTSAFKLTQVDKNHKKVKDGYEKEIIHYGSNGFEFEKLGVGHYKLQETWAIEKFEKPDPWYFEVVQDPKTYKLKIVFEKDFKSIRYTTDGENLTPKLDENGDPIDIRVANFEKIDVHFKKTDQDGKALKDALFNIKKVRKSIDEDNKTKAYEYYNSGKLKKYINFGKITEYDESGLVRKFTHDKKTYEYDDKGDLIKVNGQAPTEEDKKVRPDGITSATGKFNQTVRSQSDGEVSFQKLSEGIYELEEVSIPEGYKSDSKQFRWILKVEKDKDGLHLKYDKDFEDSYYKKYENDPKDQNSYYKKYTANNFKTNPNFIELKGDKEFSHQIKNTKTTTNLKWKKITNNEKSRRITKDVSFMLVKVSDNPDDMELIERGKIGNVAPYNVSSDTGIFEIKDLTKGLYLLSESQAPEGYEPMDRKIVIKIREVNGKLEKQLFELKQADGVTTSYIGTSTFSYLLTRKGGSELDTDNDGTFYVNNKERPYVFPISKGFIDWSKGYPSYYPITKGKLTFKIYADQEDKTNTDKKVYYKTIDLNENDKSYDIHVDGIQLNKVYILEEVEAPDGYVKTKNKYKLRFNWIAEYQTFVATLLAVIGADGKPLQNEDGKNVTEMGTYIGAGLNIGTLHGTSNFKIINNKTEIEFTKVGKDEKGEKPLEGVKFYLEKQDPKDINKENQGYYPLTAKMQFIKSELGRDGYIHYYYEELGEDGKIHKIFADNNFTLVTEERNRGTYTSDENGKFKISNLTDGYYRVIEPEAPEYEPGKKYMQVQGPVKKFRVVDGKVYMDQKDKDGRITETELTDKNKNDVAKIVNEKSGKGEFSLTKVDEKDDPLENIQYTLHKTDATETQVGGTYKTDSKGKIVFKDLPYGYYWLKETKTKEGYILDTKKKLIALGGGDWGKTPSRKDDISKSITFDGNQQELVSTEDPRRKDVVYPNNAEGMLANLRFKIDPKITVKAGDYFTIKFSDNVDLDGIFRDNDGKGKNKDSQFDIIGPAGKLAEAKVNDDRRSITYTFTNYVNDYKPDFMSMIVQLFANRRKIDHSQDIRVTADVGDNNTNESKYHYSDFIKIDYRGQNEKGNYTGYQNPKVDISSYMLRLDPDNQTFTAIIYYNPWNKSLANKNITFTTDQDIMVDENLSVKTYVKNGKGSNESNWTQGDLPDSYDVDFNRDDLSLVTDSENEYDWKPTRTWRTVEEVGRNDDYDYWKYDYNYGYRYFKYVWKDNKDEKITRQINIPTRYLNEKNPSNKTYVIEIKGKLKGKSAKSLKTTAYYSNHNVYYNGGYWYSHTGSFETWSQFFNPGGLGEATKEIKLLNVKNKIEFVKVDGGVISNVVDQTAENPEKLKDLGLGNTLKGAKFKLQIKEGNKFIDSSYDEKISDENGIFSWQGLKEGEYQVIETKTPDNDIYDLPEKPIAHFEVDKDGNIVNIKPENNIIENYRKAKIKIRKTNQDGLGLQGAEFLLTPKSGQKDPTDPKKELQAKTLTSKQDGTIESDPLTKGKYILEEKKAPKGYTKSDTIWELEVTKDGKIRWTNSFDDSKDQTKNLSITSYSGDSDKENLKSEILGIDTLAKTFRQKITIKAKPSELENARLILEKTNADQKLTQANTKVRLVQVEKNTIKDKDDSSYTVEINNGQTPNLILRIKTPYMQKIKNNPQGSSTGQTSTTNNDDAEREYQFIVDMPYKDDTKIGAKVSYDIGSVDQNTGKLEFKKEDIKTTLDKYLSKPNFKIQTTNVDMKSYTGKYLDRDINLITTDVANIKNPDIYFKKVDADDGKALSGAIFEIQRKNDKGEFLAIKENSDVFIPSGTSSKEKWTASSSSDEKTKGQFEFKNIPNGEYQIVETKAPDKYTLVEKIVFKFKVENGKIYYIDRKTNNISKIELTGNDKTKPNSDSNRILITNKKAEYPKTGGFGVWIGYTIIGLLVMLISVLIYFKKKDKLIV